MGDILIVGVSSDKRVRHEKGDDRPIQRHDTRITVIDAVKYVDYVFLMPLPAKSVSPTFQVLATLRTGIFADHKEKRHKWAGLEKKIASTGAVLVFDEQPKINSTTKIIQRTMLSRPRQGYRRRIISAYTF